MGVRHPYPVEFGEYVDAHMTALVHEHPTARTQILLRGIVPARLPQGYKEFECFFFSFIHPLSAQSATRPCMFQVFGSCVILLLLG